MLRNKEPELAEKIDSSFGCFDLGFYRVNFVFGSRHLIIVQPHQSAALLRKRSVSQSVSKLWGGISTIFGKERVEFRIRK